MKYTTEVNKKAEKQKTTESATEMKKTLKIAIEYRKKYAIAINNKNALPRYIINSKQ